MGFEGRRSRAARDERRARQQAAQEAPEPTASGEVMPLDPTGVSGPPERVWTMLQEAGEEAARLLLAELQSPAFKSYSGAVKRALIDLALTRAYGLPVRRSIDVNLTSNDADAVAASLIALTDALPERAARQPSKSDLS